MDDLASDDHHRMHPQRFEKRGAVEETRIILAERRNRILVDDRVDAGFVFPEALRARNPLKRPFHLAAYAGAGVAFGHTVGIESAERREHMIRGENVARARDVFRKRRFKLPAF